LESQQLAEAETGVEMIAGAGGYLWLGVKGPSTMNAPSRPEAMAQAVGWMTTVSTGIFE